MNSSPRKLAEPPSKRLKESEEDVNEFLKGVDNLAGTDQSHPDEILKLAKQFGLPINMAQPAEFAHFHQFLQHTSDFPDNLEPPGNLFDWPLVEVWKKIQVANVFRTVGRLEVAFGLLNQSLLSIGMRTIATRDSEHAKYKAINLQAQILRVRPDLAQSDTQLISLYQQLMANEQPRIEVRLLARYQHCLLNPNATQRIETMEAIVVAYNQMLDERGGKEHGSESEYTTIDVKLNHVMLSLTKDKYIAGRINHRKAQEELFVQYNYRMSHYKGGEKNRHCVQIAKELGNHVKNTPLVERTLSSQLWAQTLLKQALKNATDDKYKTKIQTLLNQFTFDYMANVYSVDQQFQNVQCLCQKKGNNCSKCLAISIGKHTTKIEFNISSKREFVFSQQSIDNAYISFSLRLCQGRHGPLFRFTLYVQQKVLRSEPMQPYSDEQRYEDCQRLATFGLTVQKFCEWVGGWGRATFTSNLKNVTPSLGRSTNLSHLSSGQRGWGVADTMQLREVTDGIVHDFFQICTSGGIDSVNSFSNSSGSSSSSSSSSTSGGHGSGSSGSFKRAPSI
jgi:hypothetical protein